jgi:gluconokinase
MEGTEHLPRAILLMGVSGCGKSTTGEGLAAELGWPFRDADSFHPAANIEKMSRGIPLSDEDRWPWLEAIAAWLDERIRKREPGIVSCSALKKTYRRLLLDGRPDVQLVYLKGELPLIGRRMARRVNHFMPPSLLESQFDALEEPDPTEWPIIVPIDTSPRRIVEHILAYMAGSGRGRD